MDTPAPPARDEDQTPLRGLAARFVRTLRLCGEVTRRVWRDPHLGPRYRAIVYWQGLGVVVIVGILLALGVGIQTASKFDLDSVLALLTSLWAVLLAAHLVVIALSYRFHDHLTRQASLLLGVYPEDDAQQPRVKLDFKWINKRIRRQVRGFLVMLPGFVLFSFVSVFAGKQVSALLGAAWVAHWWMVFSLAKTARAWHEPAIAEPWYARLWDAGGRTFTPLRWAPFLWWRHYMSNAATSMWSPLTWFERRSAEGAALSMMRLLANVPAFGMALRPLVPLCAALVIEHGDGALDFVQGTLGAGEPVLQDRRLLTAPVPQAVGRTKTPPAASTAAPAPAAASRPGPPSPPRPGR